MSNIYGIGVDAVAIDRMQTPAITEHAVARLFHPSEVEQARGLEGRRRAEFLASRFAAKEAFSKAMGTGFRNLVPSEIAVRVDEQGKPSLQLNGASKDLLDTTRMVIHLSITHEGPLALAFVVIESLGGSDGSS
jgi:holo-[acyl-carrier protein] synthase